MVNSTMLASMLYNTLLADMVDNTLLANMEEITMLASLLDSALLASFPNSSLLAMLNSTILDCKILELVILDITALAMICHLNRSWAMPDHLPCTASTMERGTFQHRSMKTRLVGTAPNKEEMFRTMNKFVAASTAVSRSHRFTTKCL